VSPFLTVSEIQRFNYWLGNCASQLYSYLSFIWGPRPKFAEIRIRSDN